MLYNIYYLPQPKNVIIGTLLFNFFGLMYIVSQTQTGNSTRSTAHLLSCGNRVQIDD